jgi:signal transduction histidine kinase
LSFEILMPPAGLPPLPAAVEVNAYRIILEALNNDMRHAQATCCFVTFQIEQDVLLISMQDDGVGMPKEYRAGVGLRSMRARAREIGGELRVESVQPHGTCIIARLPLYS